MTPPITPGTSRRKNSFQFTFLCSTWLMPETPVVKHSARCTPADAVAGGTPSTLTSSVVEITPNAMPSAPSTICARKPTARKGSKPERSIASNIAPLNNRRESTPHRAALARGDNPDKIHRV